MPDILNVQTPAQLAASGVISEDAAADMAASAGASAAEWRQNSRFQPFSKNSVEQAIKTGLGALGIASIQDQQDFNTWSADRANRFSAEQAALANAFSRSEREAAQAFNAEQARLQRDFEAQSAGQARAFNQSEAAAARAWSREMRQTAFQDTVADLKAAGLNPALAYSQGSTGFSGGTAASSAIPSGSSASSIAPTSHAAQGRSAPAAVARSLSAALGSMVSSAAAIGMLFRRSGGLTINNQFDPSRAITKSN